MAIRIDRIKVNRGGPLNDDFEFEPGDLNLIYGHNETGKTYIVESIISLLFRTGGRPSFDWKLRKWDFTGRIIVSGIENDPVPFTKTSKKLDDYWEEETGLPRDFARLLVVKAGETLLTGEKDGVGRDILKNYLSGEGLLDEITNRISTTIQSTTVQEGQIVGHARGEIKTRTDLLNEVDRLADLLKEVQESYASGEIYSIRREKKNIEDELEALEKAKRYHAGLQHKKIQDLSGQKEMLPSAEELTGVETDIGIFESKKTEEKRKSGEFEEVAGARDDCAWTKNAQSVYQEIMSGQATSGPKPVYMYLAILFLAAAVVLGLFELIIPLVLCAIVSVVLLIHYHLTTRKALATAGSIEEKENLRTGYKNRFGSELTDKATLDARMDKLNDDRIKADTLNNDLDELKKELNSLEKKITDPLRSFTGSELSPTQWRRTVVKLRGTVKKCNDSMDSLDRGLHILGVPEDQYLESSPGVEWDLIGYEYLKTKLDGKIEYLENEESKLDTLKTRVLSEVGGGRTEWEELITALHEKHEEKSREYREITADILAKVQVNAVLQEFRAQENARIAKGLKKEELTDPLNALTDTYISIRHEEGGELVLVTDEDEEYLLSDLSTGAREQALLSLRIGFASIAMKGKSAFLILDDAFQHSDWHRRRNLINHTLSLVKTGWQVFCFTMDDHIRDLFQEAGAEVEKGFKSKELC